jgi:hypothetical protein
MSVQGKTQMMATRFVHAPRIMGNLRIWVVLLVLLSLLTGCTTDTPDEDESPNPSTLPDLGQIAGSWMVTSAEGPDIEDNPIWSRSTLPWLHLEEDGIFFLIGRVASDSDECTVENTNYNCVSHERDEDSLDPGYSCDTYPSCGTYTVAPMPEDLAILHPEFSYILNLSLQRTRDDVEWTTVTLRWLIKFEEFRAENALGTNPGSRGMTLSSLPLKAEDLELFSDDHWTHLCHRSRSECQTTYRALNTSCRADAFVHRVDEGDATFLRPLTTADRANHCP